MDILEHFEVIGRRGFYRPTGEVSFERAVELVGEAIRHARSQSLGSLLVNTTGFTGITPPSIFGRHAMAVKWAESAGPNLPVAVVARAELIDADRIGVVMVQNRGATANVFSNEANAIQWLDARQEPAG
jgi:hypothetical protein